MTIPGAGQRRIVVPGEVVATGTNLVKGENLLRVGDSLIATRVGLLDYTRNRVRVIPLSGIYIPRVDDRVVGKVVDYGPFAWEVDINAALPAYLPAQDVFGRGFSPARHELTSKFAVGDLIYAVIVAYDRTRDPQLSVRGPGLGKIPSGEIVKISATRVPRLIGRGGSMVKIIEEATNTRITVGQNGVVVVNGPAEGILRAVSAIRMVEEQAHTTGLTERVQRALRQGNLPPAPSRA
jgi:exosome complex component RRP4